MKAIILLITINLIVLPSLCNPFSAAAETPDVRILKPRIIVITDLKRVHETDDFQSLIRLLSLVDLVEIEGIIISSGYNYWKPEHFIEGCELIPEIIESYRHSVNNLMKMNGQSDFKLFENQQEIGYWPSPDYLLRRVAAGTSMVGMKYVGAGNSSDGSRLIINVVDEEDARPVYILAWGGANVLAQAIWDITVNPHSFRSAEAIDTFIKKIRVISIGDQDDAWSKRNNPDKTENSHYWMRQEYPGLFWVKVPANPFAKLSNEMQGFYQMHIQGHGALGNKYPDHSNSVEGDTPSLLYVLPLHFGNPEKPWESSVAGTFALESSSMQLFSERDLLRQANAEMTEKMLIPFWNMFAARMDWARSATGNRPPVIRINKKIPSDAFEMTVKARQEVWIDASGSFDRESDKLMFEWYLMDFPGNSIRNIILEQKDNRARIFLPPEASGKCLHLMLEVTDDGAGHHLTSWQRIILNVE
jgi:hypothetical protein